MNVFVTGATGFLGSHLCRHLVNKGFTVSAICRSEKKKLELSQDIRDQINWIQGDLFSNNWDLKKYDFVFHLAGFIGYKPEDHEMMQKVNVEGTKVIINKIKDAHYIPKLIYLSSVVAIGAGHKKTEVLNENSVFNVSNYNFGYFDTKKEAEDYVLEETKKGLFAVALNPSTIYGAGDMKKGSRKAQLKVAKGKLKFCPKGGVSIIHVDDVCKAIISSLDKGISGERYILSGENITIKELFTLVANASGVKPSFTEIPTSLLLGIGHFFECLKFIGLKPQMSLENLKVATMYHWFNNEKARNELDLNPKPAKAAIEESIKWAKEQNYI